MSRDVCCRLCLCCISAISSDMCSCIKAWSGWVRPVFCHFWSPPMSRRGKNSVVVVENFLEKKKVWLRVSLSFFFRKFSLSPSIERNRRKKHILRCLQYIWLALAVLSFHSLIKISTLIKLHFSFLARQVFASICSLYWSLRSFIVGTSSSGYCHRSLTHSLSNIRVESGGKNVSQKCR